MKTTSKPTSIMTHPLIWLSILLVLFLIALNFISGELKYFSFKEESLGRFWNHKWWLVGHLTGGILALIIGPFQFWENFRNKYLKVHRLMGITYVLAILIASLCSTYLAWTSAVAIHWTWAIALQGLALAWVITVLMAFRFIKLKRIKMHQEWMIRSYVVTFAFITFRWLVDLPFVVELGNFIERAPTIGWISWVLPLFITEVILQWNKK
jgi:hypothetical protein